MTFFFFAGEFIQPRRCSEGHDSFSVRSVFCFSSQSSSFVEFQWPNIHPSNLGKEWQWGRNGSYLHDIIKHAMCVCACGPWEYSDFRLNLSLLVLGWGITCDIFKVHMDKCVVLNNVMCGWTSWVWKIVDRFRRIYRIHLLELATLGSWSIMPQDFPKHCSEEVTFVVGTANFQKWFW